MNQEEKYLSRYMSVVNICRECDLFSEYDESCIVNDKNIMGIIKSDEPLCPIGEW